MVEVMRQIDMLLLFAMVIPATAFPIVYGALADWRQTRGGQSVMLSAIALALLIDISVLGHFIRVDSPVVSVIITTAVFVLILAGSGLQLGVLVCTQLRARRRNPRKDGS